MFNALHGKCDVFFMFGVGMAGGCYVFQGGGVKLSINSSSCFYCCALGVCPWFKMV